MNNLPAWVIVIPFSGAVLTWLLPLRPARIVGLLTGALTAVAVGTLGVFIWSGSVSGYSLGGFGAPLGIILAIDGLAAWMLILSALVNLAIGAYAFHYFGESTPRFWPMWLMLWGGLNALALSSDLFNLYVTLEVVSLTAVALVTLSSGTAPLAAALRYLFAAMLGSLVYLLGVALIYGEHGVLALPLLADLEVVSTAMVAGLVLLTAGLLLKTAIFPFHFWLPEAHANAPAPVSALLSALVVKASFYLLLRLWLFVYGELELSQAAPVLGVLGGMAVLYGSLQALRQERLKLLVAYSTVAQLGYLALSLPLVVGTAPDVRALAYQGVAYHMMAHGLVKASLFLAAGSVQKSFGHDRIDDLRGMASALPLTTFVIGLAAVSLMGLPPSGGFVAKWWLVSAALEGGQVGWGLAILLGGLLTALYMFRLLGIGFPPAAEDAQPRREERALVAPALVLALLVVGIGLRSVELIELLHVGAPFDLFGEAGQ